MIVKEEEIAYCCSSCLINSCSFCHVLLDSKVLLLSDNCKWLKKCLSTVLLTLFTTMDSTGNMDDTGRDFGYTGTETSSVVMSGMGKILFCRVLRMFLQSLLVYYLMYGVSQLKHQQKMV